MSAGRLCGSPETGISHDAGASVMRRDFIALARLDRGQRSELPIVLRNRGLRATFPFQPTPNPPRCLMSALPQSGWRLPSEDLAMTVVTVAPSHTLRFHRVVYLREAFPRDLTDKVDEFVDRDEFVLIGGPWTVLALR